MQANTEKTELALKQASTEINAFVVNAEEEVKRIEEEYGSVIPNASTKSGYEHCKSVRRDLMPIKSGLEDARKTLKAPILAAGKLIDGSLKPLADRVDAVITPFVDAYREVDNEKKRKEEERQVKIQSAFDRMNSVLNEAVGSTSSVIEGLIDDFADFDFDPKVFAERTDEAVSKHAEIMDKLSGLLQQAIASEEQQRKLEEIEARERAIREKEEAEQRKAEEARQRELAEQQRIESEKAAAEAAEQAKLEAEKRHKQQMAEAEERAKRDAELAVERERQRAEAERKHQEEEAKRREADRAHKATIHNEILTALLSTGISEDEGKAIISMAAKRQAGNLFISY